MGQEKSTLPPRFNILLAVFAICSTLFLFLLITFLFLRIRSQTTTVFTTSTQEMYRGTLIEPPVLLNDFTMPASTGTSASLNDFRGKWVLMFFGFTNCPDVCPMTMTQYVRTLTQLNEDADDVRVLFVSVDGARDTPDVLARYVSRFGPAFIGLQGNPDTLEQIQPQFGLWYEFIPRESDPENYYVDHSALTYVIDPQGALRIVYAFGTDTNVMIEGIQNAMRHG